MQGKESRKFKIKDYNKVILLKRKGLSNNKIGKLTKISTATIWHWVNTNRKPRFIYAKRQQRSLLNYSKRLSKELGYIMGVLIGDGHMEVTKSNHRINLFVKDKDFAIYFYNILEKWSKLKPTIYKKRIKTKSRTKYGNWIISNSIMYTVRLNSVQAVNFLKNKIDCRTYSWKVPKLIINCENKKIICAFLRGFFDSEGYPVFSKRKHKVRRIEATILNSNKGLEDIQKLLLKLGIKSSIVQSKWNTFAIRTYDKDSINNFNKKIGFTIKRKRIILNEMVNSYKREHFDGKKTIEDIILSLKSEPKTIREISLDINKSYSTIEYHLGRLKNKIEIVGIKSQEGAPYSNLWSLIR